MRKTLVNRQPIAGICRQLCLVSVIAITGCGRTETGSQALKPDDEQSAQANRLLQFDPAIVEFGSIHAGNASEMPVRITNVSGKDLHILEIKTGCGCAVVDPPESPLLSGDATEVTVRLRPSTRSKGDLRRTIRFVLDDFVEPVALDLRASVLAVAELDLPIRREVSDTRTTLQRVQVFPRRLNAGRFSVSDPVRHEVVLRNVRAVEDYTPVVTSKSEAIEIGSVAWEGTAEGLAVRFDLWSAEPGTGSVRDEISIQYLDMVGTIHVSGMSVANNEGAAR